jgi:hypothetical protein
VAVNLIKGRLGEALVTALFQQAGWQVLPFGIETFLPVGKGRILSKNSKATQDLRALPDLVVYHPQPDGTIHPYLVEVKTHLREPALEDNEQHRLIVGVWVSPAGIQARWLGRDASPNHYRRIEHVLSLDLDTIEEFHTASARLHS